MTGIIPPIDFSDPSIQYALSIAANLATDVIKWGGSRLVRAGFGDKEQQAYREAWRVALATMLVDAAPDLDRDELGLLEEIFGEFIRDSDVAASLVQTSIEGEPLDIDLLQNRFNAIGFDQSTLTVDLDRALQVLHESLVNVLFQKAAEQDSPLFNKISLSISRENLVLQQTTASHVSSISEDIRNIKQLLEVRSMKLGLEAKLQEREQVSLSEARSLVRLQSERELAIQIHEPGEAGVELAKIALEFKYESYFVLAASTHKQAAIQFESADMLMEAAEQYVEVASSYLRVPTPGKESLARSYLQNARQLLPEDSNTALRARIHLIEARIHLFAGDKESAEAELGTIEDLLVTLPPKDQQSIRRDIAILLAMSARIAGDLDSAKRILSEALDQVSLSLDRTLQYPLLCALAFLHAELGEWPSVDQRYWEIRAKFLSGEKPDSNLIVETEAFYAATLAQRGNGEAAKAAYDELMALLLSEDIDATLRARVIQDMAVNLTRHAEFLYWQDIMSNDSQRVDLNRATLSNDRGRLLLATAADCFVRGDVDQALRLSEEALAITWLERNWSGMDEIHQRQVEFYTVEGKSAKAVLAAWERGDEKLIDKTVNQLVDRLPIDEVKPVVHRVNYEVPTAYRRHSSIVTLTHLADVIPDAQVSEVISFAFVGLDDSSNPESTSIKIRRQAAALLRSLVARLSSEQRTEIVNKAAQKVSSDHNPLVRIELLSLIANLFENGVISEPASRCEQIVDIVSLATEEDETKNSALFALFHIANAGPENCRDKAVAQLRELNEIAYISALGETVDLQHALVIIDELIAKNNLDSTSSFGIHATQLRTINSFNDLMRGNIATRVVDQLLSIINNENSFLFHLSQTIVALRLLPDEAVLARAETIIDQLVGLLGSERQNPQKWRGFEQMLGSLTLVQRESLFTLGRLYHLASESQRQKIDSQFVVFAESEKPTGRTGVALGLCAIDRVESIPLEIQLLLLSLVVDDDELTRHYAGIASANLIERRLLDKGISDALLWKMIRQASAEQSSLARRAVSIGLAKLLDNGQLDEAQREAVLGALASLKLDVNFQVRRHAIGALEDQPDRDTDEFPLESKE